MNVNRAGKQQQAFWRAQNKLREKWEAEVPITEAEKAYGQYLRTCERLQGHAAGWIDGARWAKRQRAKEGGGSKYLLIQKGQHLKAGDEIWDSLRQVWLPCAMLNIGRVASGHTPCRRPVTKKKPAEEPTAGLDRIEG